MNRLQKTLTAVLVTTLFAFGLFLTVTQTNAETNVGSVTSFTIFNSSSDKEVGTLSNGQTISIEEVGSKINFRANVVGSIESVRFYMDGGETRLENVAPYAAYGNGGKNYYDWTAVPGTHTLRAIPYSQDRAKGETGSTYEVTFTIVKSGDSGGGSTDPVDNTSPTTPNNVSASRVGDTNAALITWNASTDASGISTYTIYRNGSAIGTTPNTTYTDQNLTPGGTYSYTVKATDNAGNSSATSQASSVEITTIDTTAPTTPGNFKAEAKTTDNQGQRYWIELSWNVSTDDTGVLGYTIFRDGVLIARMASVNRSYNDVDITNGQTYTYTILAYDEAGNESSKSPNVTVTAIDTVDTSAPTAPSFLSVSLNTQGTIASLSWGASSDNIKVEKYNIYRNNSPYGTTGGTVISFADQNLSKDTTYTYEVTAVDAKNNESAPSPSKSVTIASPSNTSPVISLDNVLKETSLPIPGGVESAVRAGVTASDAEDGDLTSSIAVSYAQSYGDRLEITRQVLTQLGYDDSHILSLEGIISVTGLDTEQGIDASASLLNSFGITTDTQNSTIIRFLANSKTYISGDSTLTAEYYGAFFNVSDSDGATASSKARIVRAVEDPVVIDDSAPRITSFVLMNADTDTSIRTLGVDNQIDLKETGDKLNILINANDKTTKILSTLNGSSLRTENNPPFAVFGNSGDNYWNWNAKVGTYTIVSTPYEKNTAGASVQIKLTIIDSTNDQDNSGGTGGGETDLIPPTNPATASAQQIGETSSISITWDTATDDRSVAGYLLYRNNNLLVSTSNTNHTDNNLPEGTYLYAVRAFDSAGNVSLTPGTQVSATVTLPEPTGGDPVPPNQNKVLFVYGDIADNGTYPSGSRSPYHQMRLVDNGDEGFSQFNATLESEGYDLTELYDGGPGAYTFTPELLSRYDVLFLASSQKPLTNTELTNITSWVNNGGALFGFSDSALGGSYGQVGVGNQTGQEARNPLFGDKFGMYFSVDQGGGNTNLKQTSSGNHYISSPSITFRAEGMSPVLVDPSHPAQPFVIEAFPKGIGNTVGLPALANTQNAWIAGAEVGSGRVIAYADRNTFWNNGAGTKISEEDNAELTIRMIDWLTKNESSDSSGGDDGDDNDDEDDGDDSNDDGNGGGSTGGGTTSPIGISTYDDFVQNETEGNWYVFDAGSANLTDGYVQSNTLKQLFNASDEFLGLSYQGTRFKYESSVDEMNGIPGLLMYTPTGANNANYYERISIPKSKDKDYTPAREVAVEIDYFFINPGDSKTGDVAKDIRTYYPEPHVKRMGITTFGDQPGAGTNPVPDGGGAEFVLMSQYGPNTFDNNFPKGNKGDLYGTTLPQGFTAFDTTGTYENYNTSSATYTKDRTTMAVGVYAHDVTDYNYQSQVYPTYPGTNIRLTMPSNELIQNRFMIGMNTVTNGQSNKDGYFYWWLRIPSINGGEWFLAASLTNRDFTGNVPMMLGNLGVGQYNGGNGKGYYLDDGKTANGLWITRTAVHYKQ